MIVGFVPPSIPTRRVRATVSGRCVERPAVRLPPVRSPPLCSRHRRCRRPRRRAADPPPRVVVVTDVGEGAQQTMPRDALAQARRRVRRRAQRRRAKSGPRLPDEAQCRARARGVRGARDVRARARGCRGWRKTPDRAYGDRALHRTQLRHRHGSGDKTVPIESDPLDDAARGELEPSAERTWERAVRTTLAREPLDLTVVRGHARDARRRGPRLPRHRR